MVLSPGSAPPYTCMALMAASKPPVMLSSDADSSRDCVIDVNSKLYSYNKQYASLKWPLHVLQFKPAACFKTTLYVYLCATHKMRTVAAGNHTRWQSLTAPEQPPIEFSRTCDISLLKLFALYIPSDGSSGGPITLRTALVKITNENRTYYNMHMHLANNSNNIMT